MNLAHRLALAALSITLCAPALSSSVASATPAPVAPPDAPARLVRVANPSHVCMVNDQDMERPQIPVVFEGRTYYGCCKMCVAKIQNQPEVRTATDPVTGRKVDKASAVIGRRASGEVLYFESAKSLEKYGT